MILEFLLVVSLGINLVLLVLIPAWMRTIVVEELKRFFEE